MEVDLVPINVTTSLTQGKISSYCAEFLAVVLYYIQFLQVITVMLWHCHNIQH
jgi:hypothetical protein